MVNGDNRYEPPGAELIDKRQQAESSIPEVLEGSPLSPANLVFLFIRPSRFFVDKQWLLKFPEVLLFIWISGIASAINRLDTQFFKLDYGVGSMASHSYIESLGQSWAIYWVVILALGVFNGVILWYLAGWWYRLRLSWSGAKGVAPKHARAVYIYQDFVGAAPILCFSALLVIGYANYLEYWTSDEMFSILLLIFPFWSCFVSYKAARSFPTKKWPARIWFLILPIGFYVFAVGLFGGLAFWLEGMV